MSRFPHAQRSNHLCITNMVISADSAGTSREVKPYEHDNSVPKEHGPEIHLFRDPYVSVVKYGRVLS